MQNAYEIGEALRTQSWAGGDDYGTLATNAMDWFERCMQLNPYEAYAPLRYGMCLDWVGRHDEAQAYFNRAAELDPNGYFTVAHVGWHYMQIGNYAAAQPWFELSSRLKWPGNTIATSSLGTHQRPIVRRRDQHLATPPQTTAKVAAALVFPMNPPLARCPGLRFTFPV
ncbi:MAG: tetratricopeptide repeat protein [Candidatus Moduliflexus flocculans]|nr:tetratricopeptide repeat protein [Candidatus Moduliflexus flocculans]